MCLYVWAHLFHVRKKQEKIKKDKLWRGEGERGGIEIDPGKMADKGREKRIEHQTKGRKRWNERIKVMVAAVCVSAVTKL